MRLADGRRLLLAAVVVQWVSTAAVALRADDVAFGARELVNVFLLEPVALLSAFLVAARVGGLALGAWTLLVWIAVPWVAPLYTLAPYDETMRNDVATLVVGLTSANGFLEGVALLAACALLLDRRLAPRAIGAATLAVLVVVWVTRLPLPDLSADALQANMAGLREYFWSQRVLQWVPLAGVVAIARRSVPVAVAAGAWLLGYVALRAAQPDIGYEDGEIFRELLPVFPVYVLLASALPLLVPTLAARLGPLARPLRAS
jgi:hypothetical protein